MIETAATVCVRLINLITEGYWPRELLLGYWPRDGPSRRSAIALQRCSNYTDYNEGVKRSLIICSRLLNKVGTFNVLLVLSHDIT